MVKFIKDFFKKKSLVGTEVEVYLDEVYGNWSVDSLNLRKCEYIVINDIFVLNCVVIGMILIKVLVL